MEDIKVSVVVNLVNQLGEVVRTEGPRSPKFRRILGNLNRECKHIPPVRPSVPSVFPQANGSGVPKVENKPLLPPVKPPSPFDI